MHLMMILLALGLAFGLRFISLNSEGSWSDRWQRSLFLFLLPPLMLFTTTLAIILMGTEGTMLGLQASWLSYGLAVSFITVALVLFLKLTSRARITCKHINKYPQQTLQGQSIRILETELPYIAQIGFWQPQLVVSQGLFSTLDQEQLTAALAHEQAHIYYHDTFWFFILGWLRSVTSWLPQTENLWQELLLLREIRADLKAAQKVDPLVLAESLLLVAQAPMELPLCFCATLSYPFTSDRLNQRIDALISAPPLPSKPNIWCWSWVLLSLIPAIAIPFHS